MESGKPIRITRGLVDKLLSGEEIEIANEPGIPLAREEHEELRDIISARVMKGRVEDVIVISLEKEAIDTESGKSEAYYSEEIYQLPCIRDKKWLKKSLRYIQKHNFSNYVNEI
jgi:hypothetical protein